MPALGQKQTCAAQKVMSALPPKADMCGAAGHVRLVPKADTFILAIFNFIVVAALAICRAPLIATATCSSRGNYRIHLASLYACGSPPKA